MSRSLEERLNNNKLPFVPDMFKWYQLKEKTLQGNVYDKNIN